MRYTKTYKIKPLLYSILFFSRRGFKRLFKPLNIIDDHVDKEKRKLMKEGSKFRYPFGFKTYIEKMTIDSFYDETENNLKSEVSTLTEKTKYGQIYHQFKINRKKCMYEYTFETTSKSEYIAFRFFFLIKNFRLWSMHLLQK